MAFSISSKGQIGTALVLGLTKERLVLFVASTLSKVSVSFKAHSEEKQLAMNHFDLQRLD